jgi:predicted nucleotidyltransferase
VLCLKEGLLVHQLHTEGKSATEIRDRIIRGEWQHVTLE